MHKLLLMFVPLIASTSAFAAAAPAGNDKWTVTQLSGDARVIHPGLQPASLKMNSQLAPGDSLLTGLTGRATLIRGADYIVVAPHSQLVLPSTPEPAGFTRVIQNLGTLLFKVKHTGIPHFAVDMPMLAAVVKGTTFTVVVDQQRSAVQVIQGAVQVTAMNGGMSQIVESGRTVFVDHRTPRMLINADKTVAASTAPSSRSVYVAAASETPLANIATLTGGLVRADLSAPQIASNGPATPLPLLRPESSPTRGGGSLLVPAAPAPAATSAPANPVIAIATAPSGVAAPPPNGTPSSPTPPKAIVLGLSTTSVTLPPVTTPAGTVTLPTVSVPAVTLPSVTVPAVTTPTITTPSVSVPSTTVPTVSIASNSGPSINSGPGSTSSGSSGSGSISSGTSGSGSISSGSSGSGSTSSGSGSGTALTIPSVTTPAITVPSVSTPVLPVTIPAITVPSLSTPSISIGLPTLKL
jgi:collagen type III alpha